MLFIRNNEYYFTVGGNPTDTDTGCSLNGLTDSITATATTGTATATGIKLISDQYQYSSHNHNLITVTSTEIPTTTTTSTTSGDTNLNVSIHSISTTAGINTTISHEQDQQQNQNQDLSYLAYNLNLQGNHNQSHLISGIKDEPQSPDPSGTISSITSQQLQPQQMLSMPTTTTPLLNFDQFFATHLQQNSPLISPVSLSSPHTQTIFLPTATATSHTQFVITNNTHSSFISKPVEQSFSLNSFQSIKFNNTTTTTPSPPSDTSNTEVTSTSTSNGIGNGNCIPDTPPAPAPPKADQVVCPKCNKLFANKYTLKTHQRTHLGIKAFKCDVCDKCFSQKINLTYHMKLHSGERGFLCPICSKSFTQLGNCRAHCFKKHQIEIQKKRQGKPRVKKEGSTKTTAIKSLLVKGNADNQTNPLNGISISVPQYAAINLANLLNMNTHAF